MDIAPTWVLAAILRIESGTLLNSFGPQRTKPITRGLHGERGVMQIRQCAFDDVAQPGEKFARVETSDHFAIEIGNRYLCKLHDRLGSWDKAIMAYNAGAGNYHAGYPYLKKVMGVK